MAQSSLIAAGARRNPFNAIKLLIAALDTSTGHDHDGTDSKSITATVTYGVVGDMAAAGTGTANVVGTGNAARVDHVHALGTHTHAGATTGGQIGVAAFADNAFTADAAGRAPFTDLWLTGAKIADTTITNGKLAVGIASADATGRALMATDYFNAAHVATAFATGAFDATNCEDIIADNAIPADKVNWSFAVPAGINPDDAQAIGASTGPANALHVHAITCAAPSAGLAAADAEGAATSFARSNHVHKATVTDAVDFTFGASDDAGFRWSTSDADNHAFVAFLGASKALHITDAVTTDWNVGADTHPTLYVHSATTPATDYVKLSHDATTATLQAVGGTLDFTAVGSVTVNEASGDVDFRVETNDIANGFVSDAGVNAFAFGAAGDQNKFLLVARPARSALTASTTYADLSVVPGGTFTTENNTITYTYIASAAFDEPNITKGGTDTVSVAATVYISGAPTEGATNAALYVVAGDASFATVTMRGTLTMAAQQLSMTTGNVTISSTGYVAVGASPADAGYIRLPNAGVLAWRNQAGDGNVTVNVDASNFFAFSQAIIFSGGNRVYGSDAANGDLTLDATSNGTIATAYIVAADMVDATAGSVALRVNAGAVGDGGGTQTSVNGETVIDSTNGRIYFRYAAAWHYVNQTAGFVIPEYERECPICGQGMGVGDVVAGVIEGLQSDGALHGLYTHMRCVAGRDSGVGLPQKALHEARKPKASVGGMLNAAERKAMGVEKRGDKLVPV